MNNRKRTVLVVAGSVVVLLVVGLVVFLLTRPADEENTAEPDVPTISDQAPPTSASVPAPPSGGVATGGGSTGVTGPPQPKEPEVAKARTVVDNAISAINSQNYEAMAKLACDPASVGQPEDAPRGVTAELAENPKIEGGKATAQIRLTIEGGGEPTVVPLPLERRADGTWCVPS
jgi:hypothetical protein